MRQLFPDYFPLQKVPLVVVGGGGVMLVVAVAVVCRVIHLTNSALRWWGMPILCVATNAAAVAVVATFCPTRKSTRRS